MLSNELDAHYASRFRDRELNSAATRHRRDWEALHKVDVLERRLRRARGRLADFALAGEPT